VLVKNKAKQRERGGMGAGVTIAKNGYKKGFIEWVASDQSLAEQKQISHTDTTEDTTANARALG
jgi:hypothetical protein